MKNPHPISSRWICLLFVVFKAIGLAEIQYGQAQEPAVDSFEDVVQRLADEVKYESIDGRLRVVLPPQNIANNLGNKVLKNIRTGSSHSGAGWRVESESEQFRLVLGSMLTQRDQMFGNRIAVEIAGARLAALNDSLATWEIAHRDRVTFGMVLNLKEKKVLWLLEDGQHLQALSVDGSQSRGLFERSFEMAQLTPGWEALHADFTQAGWRLPVAAEWSDTQDLLKEFLLFEDAQWQVFMQDFPDLEDKKFETRAAASQRLIAELGSRRAALLYGLLRADVSAEVKSRLRAVIQDPEQTAPDALVLRTFVNNRVEQNPGILLRLWEAAGKGSPVETPVVQQLRLITGQEFDANLPTWMNWWIEQQKVQQITYQPEIYREDIQKFLGNVVPDKFFTQALPEIQRLLRLRINEAGKLGLDRQYWQEQFGGRKPQEFLGDLQRQLADFPLPRSWVNLGGGYDLNGIGYPQILFEKIAEAAETGDPMIRYRNHFSMEAEGPIKSLNRSTRLGMFAEGRLVMHGTQPNLGEQEQFFQFEFRDSSEWGRRIYFREELDGSLCFVAVDEFAKGVVVIGQDAEGGAWIHALAGGKFVSHQAPNMEQLHHAQREWLNAEIRPLLQRVGVQWDEP